MLDAPGDADPSPQAPPRARAPNDHDSDSESTSEDEDMFSLIVTHAGQDYTIYLPEGASVVDLAESTAETLDVAYEMQTLLLVPTRRSGRAVTKPRPFRGLAASTKKPTSEPTASRGADGGGDDDDNNNNNNDNSTISNITSHTPQSFKAPFPDTAVATIVGPVQDGRAARRLQLLAPKNDTVSAIRNRHAELDRRAEIVAQREDRARAARRARKRRERLLASASASTASSTPGSRPVGTVSQMNSAHATVPASLRASASPYFASIWPIPVLAQPDRALALLVRLAHDPGVRRAMDKHTLSVGLLSELDPSANTAHEGTGVTRRLGVNYGAGQAIHLRLRTDLYDGWRTYDSIRDTLCHELAHNRFQNHGPDFWAFCRLLEREVQGGDWWKGGGQRARGDEDVWEPADGAGGGYGDGDGDDDDDDDEGCCIGWKGGRTVAELVAAADAVHASASDTPSTVPNPILLPRPATSNNQPTAISESSSLSPPSSSTASPPSDTTITSLIPLTNTSTPVLGSRSQRIASTAAIPETLKSSSKTASKTAAAAAADITATTPMSERERRRALMAAAAEARIADASGRRPGSGS